MNLTLLNAYNDLLAKGINEDDLHDAIAQILPRIEHIRDISAYLARATFYRRLRRQRSSARHAQHSSHRNAKRRSNSHSAFADIEIRETAEVLERAINHLPARERCVAELFLHEGMDCLSISELLGWTHDAVRNLLFRARQRLRRSLGMYAQ